MHLFKKKKKSGFTLIELLVVIAIIGVLASIVLASLNTARRRSRDARRVADIKQIQLALEFYFDSNGKYPLANTTCSGADSNGLQPLVTGNFIPAIPRDPSNSSTCYNYASPADPASTYHLGATLEEATNAAFNSDRDCTDTGGGCGFVAAAGGFDGTTDATNRIYDVMP